jgi:hypothetical protein
MHNDAGLIYAKLTQAHYDQDATRFRPDDFRCRPLHLLP